MKSCADRSFGVKSPSVSQLSEGSLEIETLDTFYVQRDGPINYSERYYRRLRDEYDVDADDIDIDLSTGSHYFDEKPADLSFETTLTHLIQQHKNTNKSLHELIHNAQFVCRRGVLNKLVNTPFTSNQSFMFGIKKFQGIFFIREISTPDFEKNNARVPLNVRYLLPKFRNHLVYPIHDSNNRQPDIVTTWDRMERTFVATVKTDTDAITIFYGSEVDAVDKNNKSIEIKLQNGELHSFSPFFADKMRKWFFQSKFVQADSILLGFRDNDVVHRIERLPTDCLIDQVAEENERWDANKSYAFVLRFLNNIREFYDTEVEVSESMIVEASSHTDKEISYYVREDKIDQILSAEFIATFDPENSEICSFDMGYEITESDWILDVIQSVDDRCC